MSRTISLWALRRYRSRIWRHRSPDMPVCSSVRSSRFSPSAILSPGKNGRHRSPGNPRAGSRPEAVLCGNRNPGPDYRLQKLPSRHRCGNTHSRHRRSSPCDKHIKAPAFFYKCPALLHDKPLFYRVTVHAYVPSNGICRGFAFKYGKFLLPPRFLTALSVPKVPTREP